MSGPAGGARAARPRVVLVAAVARDGTIGKSGGIPWRLPGEQAAFKASTMGTTLVMGRRTWDSLPRKPLPGRDNIVITRTPREFAAANPGAIAVASVEEALDVAASRGAAVASVIGGGEIYAAALQGADELLMTFVPVDGGGDTFFPRWDEREWIELARDVAGGAVRVRYGRRSVR